MALFCAWSLRIAGNKPLNDHAEVAMLPKSLGMKEIIGNSATQLLTEAGGAEILEASEALRHLLKSNFAN